MDEEQKTKLDWTLDYASAGRAVFPLVPGGKTPLTSNGVKDASKDPAVIRAWWAKWPDANIGMATGEPSGFTVLDCDIKPWKGKTGDVSLKALEDENDRLPDGPAQQTWSGGWQYFFQYAPGIKNSASKLGKDLDIRGEGGYIVVPPSVVTEGERTGTYQWAEGAGIIGDDAIAAPSLPPWIIEALMLKPTEPVNAPGWEDDLIANGSPNGQREEDMTKLIGYLVRFLPADNTVATIMDDWARKSQFPSDPPGNLDSDYVKIREKIPRIRAKENAKSTMNPLNDLGNGRRFAARWDGACGYSPDLDTWLVSEPQQWVEDPAEVRVSQFAKVVVDDLLDEAKTVASEKRETFLKHIRTSGSSPRIQGMIRSARSEAAMVMDIRTFDADDWTLNTPTGLVDLRTGKLIDRNGSRCRHITAAEYRPEQTPDERFMKFALTNLPDINTRKFVQEICGYSLTGERWLEIMLALYGPPLSGKTTTVEIMRRAMGSYAGSVPPEVFAKSKRDGEANRPMMASLVGLRLVTSPESGDAIDLDTGTVNSITGGDPVTAAAKYGAPFTYMPKFVWTVYGNNRPRADYEAAGLRRRIVEVPFDVRRTKADADESLKKYLTTDPRALSSWLNWAMAGLLRLQQREGRKLVMPPQVAKATAAFWEEQDVLAPFLKLKILVLDKAAFTPSAAINVAFDAWTREEMIKDPKAVTKARLSLSKWLRENGCVNRTERVVANGPKVRGWGGVRIER